MKIVSPPSLPHVWSYELLPPSAKQFTAKLDKSDHIPNEEGRENVTNGTPAEQSPQVQQHFMSREAKRNFVYLNENRSLMSSQEPQQGFITMILPLEGIDHPEAAEGNELSPEERQEIEQEMQTALEMIKQIRRRKAQGLQREILRLQYHISQEWEQEFNPFPSLPPQRHDWQDILEILDSIQKKTTKLFQQVQSLQADISEIENFQPPTEGREQQEIDHVQQEQLKIQGLQREMEQLHQDYRALSHDDQTDKNKDQMSAIRGKLREKNKDIIRWLNNICVVQKKWPRFSQEEERNLLSQLQIAMEFLQPYLLSALTE